MAVTNPFGSFFREKTDEPAKTFTNPFDDPFTASEPKAPAETPEPINEAVKPNSTVETAEAKDTVAAAEPAEDTKPKRRRRTKAEMEAARAAEATLTTDTSEEVIETPPAKDEANEDSTVKEETAEESSKSLEKDNTEPVQTVKTAEAPVTEEKSAPVKPVPIKHNAGSITTQNIADLFAPIKDDTDWKEFEEDIKKRIDDIKVKSDINFGSARILLEQVTDLLVLLNNRKAEVDAYDDTFNSRTIGIIERAKIANSSGKNQDERDKNANSALEVLPWNRGKINIFDYVLAHNARKHFVYAMINSAKEKQTALFNYIAIMKLEQGMIS